MERERSELNAKEVESLDTLKMLANIEDDKTGINFLDMAAWNVEQAMNLYLDYGTNPISSPQQIPQNFNNPNDFSHIPDMNAPPVYQPMMDDLQPNLGHGGIYQEPSIQSPLGPMPQFNSDQMEFYKKQSNKGLGGGGMISKGFKAISSSLSFQKKTGQMFIDCVAKIKDKSMKVVVNFMNANFEDALEMLQNQSSKPILFFLFDKSHSFAKPLVNNFLCSEGLGTFINKNFMSFGMLNDSKEKPSLNPIIANPTVPCIMVLRRDKLETMEVLGENFFTFKDQNSFVDKKLMGVLTSANNEYNTKKTEDQ